jgi:hypothetical protein
VCSFSMSVDAGMLAPPGSSKRRTFESCVELTYPVGRSKGNAELSAVAILIDK